VVTYPELRIKKRKKEKEKHFRFLMSSKFEIVI
jgi:hypothetical protein